MNLSAIKKLTATAAAATLMLGTAACGSGDSTDDEGRREITVGIVPTVDLAPLMYAVEQGYFEDEGLVVETRVTSGGAEAIPALVAGDLDVVFSAYTPILQARQRGLDVQVVSGSHFNDAAEYTPSGLWTQEDSDVETMSDLKGKTIAVNTLGSVAHLLVVASLDELGLSTDDYELLEVPFPDVPAALDQNRVDAAWVAEPSRARVITELNGRFVGSEEDPALTTTVEELQNMPMAGYAARGDEDDEVKEGFYTAMAKAMQEINDDPSIAIDLAPSYTEIPDELLENVAVSTFSQVEVEDLERLERLMVQYGLLDEASDNLDGSVYKP